MEWLPESNEASLLKKRIQPEHSRGGGDETRSINRLAKLVGRNTKCSFGIRTGARDRDKDKDKLTTPGFNYNIPSHCTRFGRQPGPSFTFGRRIPDHFERMIEERMQLKKAGGIGSVDNMPSQVKKKVSGPVLIGRNWGVTPVNNNPGPGAYNIPSTLGKGPSVRFHPPGRSVERLQKQEKSDLPGPGQYDITPVEVTKKGAPAFGLKGRSHPPKGNMYDTPAPNKYKLPTSLSSMKAAPNFSFGKRHTTKSMGMLCPEDKAWSAM